MNANLTVVTLLATSLISGCAQNSADVQLTDPFLSKGGSLRELGQLGNILTTRALPFGPLSGGERPAFAEDLSQTPTEECESGTVEVERSEQDRPLQYYPSTARADVEHYLYVDCVVADSQQNGPIERGTMQGFENTNLSDSLDRFAIWGETEAYVYETTNRQERVEGRVEWRDFDIGRESASIISRTLELTGSEPYSLEWRQGLASEPLRLDHGLQGDIRTIAGPYSYRSSRCSGGARRVQGRGIAADEDGYPASGLVEIAAGSETLMIEFDDGGASVTFSNGQTTRLSVVEVRRAFDEPVC